MPMFWAIRSYLESPYTDATRDDLGRLIGQARILATEPIMRQLDYFGGTIDVKYGWKIYDEMKYIMRSELEIPPG